MAEDRWGSVDGDTNASAIISDRRRDLKSLNATLAVFVLILFSSAVWYAVSGSRVALALEIVSGSICASGWVRKDLYVTHTIALIAERRIQLVEQQVEGVRVDADSRYAEAQRAPIIRAEPF